MEHSLVIVDTNHSINRVDQTQQTINECHRGRQSIKWSSKEGFEIIKVLALNQCPKVKASAEHNIEIALHKKFHYVSPKVDKIILFVCPYSHVSSITVIRKNLSKDVDRYFK